ncbi:16S rRNA processing protein RimM [Olsenella sp. YH-ols2217]|uniref:Ribosome maturation factor RimM n=1 Tax=Kribbibacterium absianum TaxID=3044210 RepID=A0ABT6ZIZ9_9ACTN|nr:MULTISPECIES: 16S rRNA processing protein RimM [unclassified Olsenella]MDJ1121535.1 16S rRNA processing protein RimM [Olsenella sp. YH-ols2216]MDJ1129025.1 16S rRNA processing protein RimM [Olsenella sp. YH-ols2217]
MASEYRIIARVAKAHGSRGKVVCQAADGLPLLLRPGLEVWVVPPTLKGPRHGAVASVEEGPRGVLVGLTCCEDRDGAESVAGRFLLARRCDLPEDLVLRDAAEAIGLPVEDVTFGALGEVVDVLEGPVQDVWVVEGPFGEVLVPAVEELLVDVTDEAVVFDLPSGIVPAEGAEP